MKKLSISDLLLPVLLSLVVLLTSSLIAKAQDKLTFRDVAIGAVTTACIFLMLAGLVLAFQSKFHQTESQIVIAQLRELIPPSDFPWPYTDAELARAESKAKGDRIWIISPDLVNVTEKPVIIDAVKKNIKRRITYTHFVPDSDEINLALRGLQQLFTANAKQLNIASVPKDQFRLLSVTHIAIFNLSGISPDVFLELPIEDPHGKRIRGYWIRVSKEATAG